MATPPKVFSEKIAQVRRKGQTGRRVLRPEKEEPQLKALVSEEVESIYKQHEEHKNSTNIKFYDSSS